MVHPSDRAWSWMVQGLLKHPDDLRGEAGRSGCGWGRAWGSRRARAAAPTVRSRPRAGFRRRPPPTLAVSRTTATIGPLIRPCTTDPPRGGRHGQSRTASPQRDSQAEREAPGRTGSRGAARGHVGGGPRVLGSPGQHRGHRHFVATASWAAPRVAPCRVAARRSGQCRIEAGSAAAGPQPSRHRLRPPPSWLRHRPRHRPRPC
jgi:hypothetical protein